jgi:hypothetical protein
VQQTEALSEKSPGRREDTRSSRSTMGRTVIASHDP